MVEIKFEKGSQEARLMSLGALEGMNELLESIYVTCGHEDCQKAKELLIKAVKSYVDNFQPERDWIIGHK